MRAMLATLMLLFLIAVPNPAPAVAEGIYDLVLPIVQFLPMQQADGSRTWRFVINPRGADENTIMSMLTGAHQQ